MSLKDFKNCDVQYAYDKDTTIYSVKVVFKGKPMVLTIRVGKGLMDMTLTNKDGHIVEHIEQNGRAVTFDQDELLAKQLRK